MKEHIMTSIEHDLMEKARAKNLQISRIAEDAIIQELGVKEKEPKDLPLELAETEPDKYWISPQDNKCHIRGRNLFFINESGKVREVTESEYIKRKKSYYHEPKEIKKKKPKLGDIYLHNEQISEGA